jgi:hypothetical protein
MWLAVFIVMKTASATVRLQNVSFVDAVSFVAGDCRNPLATYLIGPGAPRASIHRRRCAPTRDVVRCWHGSRIVTRHQGKRRPSISPLISAIPGPLPHCLPARHRK